MGKIIGIDLGTGNSCVSVYEGGTPTVIVNSEGKRTTPSVISIKDGDIRVGDSAKRQAVTNPKNTVHSIKRFMGNTYDEVTEEVKRVQYDVVNDNGYPKVNINGKKYTPQELSAMILQKMKKTAEDYIGTEIKEAVITVPAYFSDSQRQATKEAGEIAGLEVKRIINEPTAAALAYGVDKGDKDLNIAVIDSGCGTYDVSILSYCGGIFEVLATSGNTHLGGDDFDQVIVDYLVKDFKDNEGVDLTKDPIAMQRFKEAAEKAKIELSSSKSTDINLPYITSIDGMPKHIMTTLTRAKFEQISSDLVEKHRQPITDALKSADLSVNEINEVILVGGTTRMPAIQNLVKEMFGKEPSKSVNPDEAVSIGACIQGAVINKEEGVNDVVLLDVTPLDLGITVENGLVAKMVTANTTIPVEKTQIFTNAVDNQTAITVEVVQGNRPMARDNKRIGIFNLEGLMPSPRQTMKIEVTFNIDVNGILSVSAKDTATGKEQSIRIEASSTLTEEEIERMKREAEENAKSDEEERKRVETINAGESAVFANKKLVEEQKDILLADEKDKLNEAINKLDEAVKEKNVDDINKRMDELTQTWQPISTRIYSANQSNGGNSSKIFDEIFKGATNNGTTPPPQNNNTQDAEVEEV